MIDYFKSFLQLDLSALSGLKPETVLKSRVTRLATLINSIFFLISHYSYFIQDSCCKDHWFISLEINKCASFSAVNSIKINAVDRSHYFLKSLSL